MQIQLRLNKERCWENKYIRFTDVCLGFWMCIPIRCECAD